MLQILSTVFFPFPPFEVIHFIIFFYISNFHLYSAFHCTQFSLDCLFKKILEIKKLKIPQAFLLWSLISFSIVSGAHLIFYIAFWVRSPLPRYFILKESPLVEKWKKMGQDMWNFSFEIFSCPSVD